MPQEIFVPTEARTRDDKADPEGSSAMVSISVDLLKALSESLLALELAVPGILPTKTYIKKIVEESE